VPTAEYYDSLYYLNNMEDSVGGIPVNINVELAWEETKGSGILVAVFDDGVEMEHPDFDQNFSPGSDPWYDPLNPPVGEELPDCEDIGCAYEPWDTTGAGDNHGTSVAGVLAGSWGDGIAGVAPEASIAPVRIAYKDSVVNNAQLAAAFRWAVDSADVDVINFSWIWTSSETVTTAIEYAIGQGAVIVAAAGNLGESSLRYPASLSATTDVIAVGAITKDGSLTTYSNDYPDLVTPSSSSAAYCAGDIIAANLLGAHGCDKLGATNYTNKFGGTSASAAMVSGVAALVLDLEGGLTPEEVKDQILDAVDTWGSHTPAEVGEGKLNAFASLNVTPDPVSVDELWGEVLVDTAGTYVWGVDYSGGNGQYTFLWEVWWDGTEGYVWAGNNPTQQFTLDETDPSFELRVTVSSAGTQDSDSIFVTIWIDLANPPVRDESPSGPLGRPG